jgi:hypothetical protein
MKAVLLTIALGLVTLGANAQAAPAPRASLLQVAVETQDEVVDVQFNNPLEQDLYMVLLGQDGHVVFRKKWKKTNQYHGQFLLADFPEGQYTLEMRRADTTLTRDLVQIGMDTQPEATLANKP